MARILGSALAFKASLEDRLKRVAAECGVTVNALRLTHDICDAEDERCKLPYGAKATVGVPDLLVRGCERNRARG